MNRKLKRQYTPRTEARDILERARGGFFTVTFITKDGRVRVMNARTGVRKHTKGGQLGYVPSTFNLLPVFDVQRKGYRMINLNTIIDARVDGTEYVFYTEA